MKTLLNFVKDKNESCHNVGIYNIPCITCSSLYIGETGRNFKIRLQEHKNRVKNGDNAKSAVAKHVWKYKGQHAINWAASKIVFNEPRSNCRKLIEAIFIEQSTSRLMNSKNAHYNIHGEWKPIIPVLNPHL